MSLANGDFETWSIGVPTGWTLVQTGTSTITQETVIIHGGSSSAKLFCDVAGDDVRVQQSMSATPGLQYTASVWTRADNAKSFNFFLTVVGGASAGFFLNFATFAWQAGFTGASGGALLGNGASFQQFSVTTAALPSGATGILFDLGRGDGNYTGYIDDAALEQLEPIDRHRQAVPFTRGAGDGGRI